MATGLNCASTREGLPEGCQGGNPFTIAKSVLLVNKGTTLTPAEAAALTNYLSKVRDKSLLPIHKVFGVEAMMVEKKLMESEIGRKKTTHKGFRGYKLSFDLTPDQALALKGWQNKNLEIITGDEAGNIIFTKTATTALKGFGIDYFDVEIAEVPSAGNTVLTKLEIQESDPTEFDNIRYLNPNENTAAADRWSITDVKTISKVTLTAGTVTASVFTLNIDLDSTTKMNDGIYLSSGITGVLSANLTLLDAAGAAVAIDSLVATATAGEYTLTALVGSFTTGSIQYAAQDGDEVYFESDVLTIT